MKLALIFGLVVFYSQVIAIAAITVVFHLRTCHFFMNPRDAPEHKVQRKTDNLTALARVTIVIFSTYL